MDLESIASVLIGKGICSLPDSGGVPVFVYALPADLVESGEPAVLVMSGFEGSKAVLNTPGYYIGEFQVIVQSTDHAEGAALSKQIFAALRLSRQALSPDMTVLSCLPLHQPIAYPKNGGGIFEFSTNFKINHVNPNE